MAKTKAGFVRVGTDIPEDLHRRIKKYNKNSINPLNMSKVMLQAIENEVAKIKAAEKIIEGAVDKAMISAKGYGESRPIAPNKTKDGKDNPEGRAENRRVEILIISE